MSNLRNNKNKYRRRREDILRLRRKGWSYRRIAKKLGCSKATISYHCGKNKSEKNRVSAQKKHPLSKKVDFFKARCTLSAFRTFRSKIKTFKRRSHGQSRTSFRVNHISTPYTVADVINKIGSKPVCYLTGKKINLSDTSSYSLDHRVPTARGGTNDLDNLEICSIEANRAKADLPLEEFYALCTAVLAWKRKNKNK